MYELILFLGLISAFVAGLKAKPIGVAMGLLDDPKAEAHKKHGDAVPQVGSVLLFCGLVALAVGAALTGEGTDFLPVILCAGMLGALGIIDDRLKLSWGRRFILMWLIIAALLLLFPGLLIDQLSWSWGQMTDLGFWGGIGFTALCLVGLVIALNMMDGFNGGILSQGIVWLLVFSSLVAGEMMVVFVYLTLVLLLILGFNLPSRLFMGDGGAYALGLIMGASAIMMYGAETSVPIYADTIVVWLALPVFDCLRVIARRKMKGLSPFLPQRDHLHHLLMKTIHPWAALVFSVVYTGAAGFAALMRPDLSWLIVLVQLAVLALAVFVTSRRASTADRQGLAAAE